MEASKSNNRRRTRLESGFTMVELMMAIVVLSVGLLALAGFISRMDLTSHNSRYMSTAALLCSEKLEELSGVPPESNEIKIVSGHSAGDLAVNTSATVDGEVVSYYDTVSISIAGGAIRETTVDGTGKSQSIVQTPNGVDPDPSTTVPDATQAITFKRRWLIEDNVSGLPPTVRRITVSVDYPAGNKESKFQMTMVRNGEQ